MWSTNEIKFLNLNSQRKGSVEAKISTSSSMRIPFKMIRLFSWLLVIFLGLVTVRCSEEVTVGVVLPYSSFVTRVRAYQKQLNSTWNLLFKSKDVVYSSEQRWQNIKFETVMWPIVPSPSVVLETLCNNFLFKNVFAVIYVTDSEFYKKDVVASQYFLQLLNYIRLPVIAWNAANVGLEKKLPNSVVLQLAPTVGHQAEIMLALLVRYEWGEFCVLTSTISGHKDFLLGLKEGVATLRRSNKDLKLEFLSSQTIAVSDDVEAVVEQLSKMMSLDSGCRIFFLYSTYMEARTIFTAAKKLKMTGKDFVWIVSQSVVAAADYTPEFPVGLLGIKFDSGQEGVLKACGNAVRVLGKGLQLYSRDITGNLMDHLRVNLSCESPVHDKKTRTPQLHNYLKSVSVASEFDEDRIEFNHEGTLKRTTLQVVNLDTQLQWRTVGFWKNNLLNIEGIVWPGGSHIPPLGKPEKFHMRVTFLEEPPYLNMELPDPKSGRCRASSADLCTVPAVKTGVDPTGVASNESHQQCCSGFCVDLLQKLSRDLEFSYELKRVEDGRWGSQTNGRWNGLVAELIENKADMVMTSLKINSQRETAVDFSLPFLDTGIAVVVAKRTGIISPNAFLQPFDPVTWFIITVVSIQAGALSIFFFEWLSPAGLDRKITLPKNHKFTLFQTYWLAWAMLFKAPVTMVQPKGFTSRFMAHFWAAFAVAFIAIYTANLAVFMITREKYYDFTGVEDERLSRPMSHQPPYKFGTIPYGNTEAVIKNNLYHMYTYMRQFNRSTVFEGVKAVKLGELDAFIYDATVLDYLAGQDDDCGLLTVGSWYSMTGYGVAFPKQSKYRDLFSQQILAYKMSGELDQWEKFWLSGACRPKQDDSQNQLQGYGYQAVSFEQFISAFVLLALGIVLSLIIFVFEHCYFCSVSKLHHRRSSQPSRFWPLISQNVSQLLHISKDQPVSAKCVNPKCDLELWKVRRELDLTRMRVEQLEATVERIRLQFVQGTLL